MAGKIQKAAPVQSANVAGMINFGVDAPKPPEMSLDHLNNVAETTTPYVSEGPVEVQRAPQPEVTQEAQAPAPEQKPENAIPDKFKDKSPEQIMEMYRNLESEVGRHRNEVGEYRKFVDQLLVAGNRQTQPAQTASQPAEDPAKLLDLVLTKPHEFKKMILEEAKAELQQTGAQAYVQSLLTQNRDVIQSPDFAEWERQNVPPAVSQAAMRDPSQLQFVLNSYRAYRGSQSSTPTPPTQPPGQKVVQVGMEQGVPSPRKPAPQVFSRMKMIELRLKNEAEYVRLLPEYEKALQEGRVQP